MKAIETSMIRNVGQTGNQQFTQVKRNDRVLLFRRDKLDGSFFGFEVFTPTIKKAGTYPLPNDKTITYTEDFEEYPGTEKFGRNNAFFCTTLERAEVRFEELTNKSLGIKPEVEEPVVSEEVEETPKRRGRQPKLISIVPNGEFTVGMLAEANSVSYPIAFMYVKENLDVTVKFIKSEKSSSGRGKPSNWYSKIS